MIFVTVGTHEQQFNRLISEIDRLKGERAFDDEVIIQKGFSTYEPRNCRIFELLSYEDMQSYQKEARIIITHGGPASFIYPLTIGKMPIVVPRQKKFDEHVNDHQLEFCKQLKERDVPITLIENIQDLQNAILSYDSQSLSFVSNTENFVRAFEEEVIKLF